MDAHRGLDRWRQLKTVSARLLQGGVLWGLKGKDGILNDVHVTADLYGRETHEILPRARVRAAASHLLSA